VDWLNTSEERNKIRALLSMGNNFSGRPKGGEGEFLDKEKNY
jgi:hypothetical protein